MKFISESQKTILTYLESGRLHVLDVHAGTAAALLYRGAISYHEERDGSLSYRATKEGKQLCSLQKILDKARPYKEIRTDAVNIKKKQK